MHEAIGYRILSLGLRVGLGVAICVSAARAQQAPKPKTPTEADMYCSGLTTDQAVPGDSYIISGENSEYKISFHPQDFVYIDRGGEQGVKIGDEFEVIRPVHELMPTKWFKWQSQLEKAMGTHYADIGRLRVVRVQAKTSTAALGLSCDMMQRGDIIRPFSPRPVPTYHSTPFDPFAPPSGKKTAMIVDTKNFGMLSGSQRIVFVNLGSAQGVQVGDYFRVFRYQGSHNELVYPINGTAYKVYGFGGAPAIYLWDNLPRQVMGEGIVLRTGPNSSTVQLTFSREEIFAGDYVELE